MWNFIILVKVGAGFYCADVVAARGSSNVDQRLSSSWSTSVRSPSIGKGNETFCIRVWKPLKTVRLTVIRIGFTTSLERKRSPLSVILFLFLFLFVFHFMNELKVEQVSYNLFLFFSLVIYLRILCVFQLFCVFLYKEPNYSFALPSSNNLKVFIHC